jgi:peptidoglycan/LPS O-acetylase OafA/YrhL
LVCLAHLRNLLFPDISQVAHPSVMVKTFYFFTLFGTQAVVIFFVISGFLVGGRVVHDVAAGHFSSMKYFVDRAARLYVVLIPAIILSVALQHVQLTSECAVKDSVARLAGNAFFLQNLIVDPLCNDHPLWSLSNEAVYYIAIVPIALAFRSGAIWFAIIPVFLLMDYFASPEPLSIGVGSLIWLLGVTPWFVRLDVPVIVPLGLFAASMVLSRAHLLDAYHAGDFAIGLCFAASIAARWPAGKLPTTLVRIGFLGASFSYSLYLVHMPIAQAISAHLGGLLNPGSLLSYAEFWGAVALVVIVAAAFGFLFERRTQALRRAVMAWSGASAHTPPLRASMADCRDVVTNRVPHRSASDKDSKKR